MTVIIVIQLKKRMANVCIFGIGVCKFSHWQECCSVVLLEVDKNLEIMIFYSILTLYLTISYKMKYDEQLLRNARKVEKQRLLF